MSQELILNWLNRMSESVKKRDLNTHMGLVSKKVLVYGIPNQESLGYFDWKQRRRNEFYKNHLASLTYSNLNITTITLRRLGFQITEVMQATTGLKIHIDKEIILEQEADNEWRVVEETIKQWHHINNQDDH
ncbi:MAG: hypothetical protein OEU74_03450 [Gammaproteobacteria bacterium]|nr:hypothetical protein [Gammaproteobacteria bacterium]